MGRALTKVDGGRALISWTGTMFEYLMPLLVMKNYQATLLSETYRTIVERQIEYGEERGVPWGISEAAYNVRDLHLNYQYGPFGVPGLGFKRGLIEDLVVAPYATMLALSVDPAAAMSNLRGCKRKARLDHTASTNRSITPLSACPEGQKSVLIRAFMTHHQGMSLCCTRQHSPRRSRAQTFSLRSPSCRRPNCSCRSESRRRARRPSARRRSPDRTRGRMPCRA